MMRKIQSIFNHLLKKVRLKNNDDINYTKVPFKPLTKEICDDLKIIPLYFIPPDSKYNNEPTIREAENFLKKNIQEYHKLADASCSVGITEKEQKLIYTKMEEMNLVIEPKRIEMCNLLRKETHEKYGTCFSTDETNTRNKPKVMGSHIEWSSRIEENRTYLQRLESLVGYPKEHDYMYDWES